MSTRERIVEHIVWWLLQQAKGGMTLIDDYEYWKCCEEVDPSLDEEIALVRMREIVSRYGAPSTSAPGRERRS